MLLSRTPRRAHAGLGVLLALLAGFGLLATTAAAARPPATPGTGVPGVQDAQLSPDFWTSRLDAPDGVVLDANAIDRLNARLFAEDGSMHDLERFPVSMPRADVEALVKGLSSPPTRSLFVAGGLPFQDVDALEPGLGLDRLPDTVGTRWGLVVHRADMRTFPTDVRVFSAPGDTDIDRFQETALFPGTPLAILHESRDGEWWFAVSPRYAAWIRKSAVASGTRGDVLGYGRRTPYVVVTGATARTVHTPEAPRVSDLQLDMGVRVPLLADWPPATPVNGQAAYTGHVVELPVRDDDGALRFAPALLPRSQDVATAYLPLTPAGVIEQGFKFLGERYGWGHAYDARDCSGFVSEVYRAFGIQLPRNTSAQGVSPVFNTVRFDEGDDRASRLAVLRQLQVGDLVYVPGHVMMVIGQYEGAPYVIHDVTGISVRDDDGGLRRIVLNGVSVTPLEPLQSGEDASLVDRIYSIQKIRP
ncbi:NlpC-P60 family protein [Lysobacter aestuarii]|uniref:NlpC-P60 family protein n=2 Tax=Marilutibacter aestuarii TaxID=1706195 RepID=A0A508A5M0_9GAMM|nr:NlpC-P60 family protein [Lysobacter aestuarii]